MPSKQIYLPNDLYEKLQEFGNKQSIEVQAALRKHWKMEKKPK